jgi:hypothetical protein
LAKSDLTGSTTKGSDLLVVDQEGAPVATVGSQFLYTYDFGDDREHDVVVERVVDDGGEGITCAGGARAGPPEDCGGPGGYVNRSPAGSNSLNSRLRSAHAGAACLTYRMAS